MFGVCVSIGVDVAVGVALAVGVGMGVGVNIGETVEVGEGVRVGVGVDIVSTAQPFVPMTSDNMSNDPSITTNFLMFAALPSRALLRHSTAKCIIVQQIFSTLTT